MNGLLDLECVREVNWIDFSPLRARSGNDNTVSLEKIGQTVITRALRAENIRVGYTTPEKMEGKLLLASVSSSVDALSLRRQLQKAGRRSGQTVLIGGAGATNPFLFVGIGDYLYLGRAHTEVAAIVADVLAGRNPQNNHLVALDEMNSASMNSDAPIITTSITLPCPRQPWEEGFFGCSRMCAFCQYAHVRRLSRHRDYVQTTGAAISSELDLLTIAEGKFTPTRRVLTALDGSSERLRFAFGKPITNSDIGSAMRNLYDAGVSVVDIYNVGCFPSEKDKDIAELEAAFAGARVTAGRRPPMYVVVHTTPLRPMAFTPLFFASVSFERNWRELSGQVIRSDDALVVSHSKYMEGTASHIRAVAAERCIDNAAAQSILNIVQTKKFGAMPPRDALAALTDAQLHLLTEPLPLGNPFCDRWRSWQSNGTIYRRYQRAMLHAEGERE